MRTILRKYINPKKSLSLIIAAIFFLSTFAGDIQSCICKDTNEVITEKKSCCNDNSKCCDSEKETEGTVLDNQNCDNCDVCTITEQKIEQYYNISDSRANSKEVTKHINKSFIIAESVNSENIPISVRPPDIHTKIFIFVSNLRI